MPNSYIVDESRNFKEHRRFGLFGTSKTTQELRNSIDILYGQNKELRSSIHTLSEQLTNEKQLHERLEGENEQLEGKVDELKQRLSVSEHHLVATEYQLKLSQQGMDAHKKRCETYEAEIERLRKEIRRLQDFSAQFF